MNALIALGFTVIATWIMFKDASVALAGLAAIATVVAVLFGYALGER